VPNLWEELIMKTDAELQRDVLQALQWEPSVDATQIGVTVKGGVVTLTGHVTEYAQKFTAEAAAKRVHGVKGVANDVGVKLSDGGLRTDSDIAAAAVHALEWHAEVPDDRIRVVVRDGWIILDGKVDWQYQKEAADRVVRTLIGARGVTNNILVEPRGAPADVKADVEGALRRSAIVDSTAVSVETSDGTVTLRGAVHSWADREEAERLAWGAPGVRRVENCLELTPWGT
jgi:osmotically-inducible protein OsmY